MTPDLWWLIYPFLGIITGFMAGLFGVGGGAIMVPMLTTCFLAQGFPKETVVHMALATSLATIILTSISSARAHHAHGAIHWDIFGHITPGIIIGTIIGTFVASGLNVKPLTLFFACFMSFVALQMLFNAKPRPARQLPGPVGTSLVGSGIGFISALVAIGGGSLSVPFMVWCNVDPKHAIGTSAAIGFPIAVSGTVGYLINGWAAPGTPPLTLGFIYLPALALLGLVSILFAPLGAKLAHRLSVVTLKRAFAGVLVLLVAKMLYGVFG